MSYQRATERNRRLRKLYGETKNSCGAGGMAETRNVIIVTVAMIETSREFADVPLGVV